MVHRVQRIATNSAGTGGQLEDAFQDVLDDVLKCKYSKKIPRYQHRLLRRGMSLDVAVPPKLEGGRLQMAL